MPPTLFDFEPRPQPYAYVTWLAPYLSGERQCRFALHQQMNFRVKSPSSIGSDYLVKHQSLLEQVVEGLSEGGHSVHTERENKISITSRDGVYLQGQPDIVVDEAGQDLGQIVDVKTGQHVKGAHRAQVMLYMALAPHEPGIRGIRRIPSGQLVYASGELKFIEPEEITPEFRQQVSRLLATGLSETLPEPQPSASECRFCYLRQVCPYAIEQRQDSTPVDWL